MSKTLRFGIVGAGGIAQAYAQALQQLPDAELAAVADVDADAGAKFAESWECNAHVGHEALIASGECDAIVVCTPPITHPAIAREALGRGLPVLCEKPLAIGERSAQEMIDAAEAAAVPFAMASKFRYVDDVLRARDFIRAGEVGLVVLFENSFTGYVDMSQRWNSNPEIGGGGVLIDNGTHSVDIINFMAGPIREVHAVEGKRIQHLPVEDTAQLFVRTAIGAVGNVDLSWSLAKDQDHFLHVYGAEGIIRIGWQESRIRRKGESEWEVFGSGYDKIGAFRNQIDDFANAIRTGRAMRISTRDAIASVRVIEAAYRSLAGSQWETVADPA